MEKIAIIGAGLMGVGFAVVFAPAGHDVKLHDPYPDVLNSAKPRLSAILNDIGADASTLHRVTVFVDLAEAVAKADVILEAVIEKLPLKQDLFERIEASARSDAIFASNTSSIPITQVMAKVKNKSRALGAHWFNPPYLVPLVEVIQTIDTDMKHIEHMIALLKRLGKVAVHVKKDVPGFVGNRMQHAMWREAISLVENGVCDSETIDLVVKNSFGLVCPCWGLWKMLTLWALIWPSTFRVYCQRNWGTGMTPTPCCKSWLTKASLASKPTRGSRAGRRSQMQLCVLGSSITSSVT
jgi:3-hydroxybutyryl-CoA dehydrogenase